MKPMHIQNTPMILSFLDRILTRRPFFQLYFLICVYSRDTRIKNRMIFNAKKKMNVFFFIKSEPTDKTRKITGKWRERKEITSFFRCLLLGRDVGLSGRTRKKNLALNMFFCLNWIKKFFSLTILVFHNRLHSTDRMSIKRWMTHWE